MTRDNIKNEDYFQKYLSTQSSRIEKFEQRLINNTLKDDRILPVKKKIYHIMQDINIANYSSGKSLELIKEYYTRLLADMPKFWISTGGYIELIRMLSFAIIFNLENDLLEKVVNVVRKDNPNDYLVDFLINHIDYDWEIDQSTFKFEKPYGYLRSVLEESDKNVAIESITTYLNKLWYKGHSSASWHNSHSGKYDTYAGYWSFESAALVKILDLDDSSLKDQQYYPYDMVHWKD